MTTVGEPPAGAPHVKAALPVDADDAVEIDVGGSTVDERLDELSALLASPPQPVRRRPHAPTVISDVKVT